MTKCYVRGTLFDCHPLVHYVLISVLYVPQDVLQCTRVFNYVPLYRTYIVVCRYWKEPWFTPGYYHVSMNHSAISSHFRGTEDLVAKNHLWSDQPARTGVWNIGPHCHIGKNRSKVELFRGYPRRDLFKESVSIVKCVFPLLSYSVTGELSKAPIYTPPYTCPSIFLHT